MAHGGARQGAGRKPKAEKYEKQITRVENRIADRLPNLAENLLRLADGGEPIIEEEWQAAGLVYIDDYETSGEGRQRKVKRLAYPKKDPEELVLVRRKVITPGRDRDANKYLIDRIIGKPTEVQEVEHTGPDGGPLEFTSPELTQAARDLAVFRQEQAAKLAELPTEPPTE